jgi:lipopolysaccharide transport system ATP-binding protein
MSSDASRYDHAIRLEEVGKRYTLGAGREKYQTLRESLSRGAARLTRKTARPARGAADTVWALRDVSLNITRGRSVGIIGHNGSGKSTLLKILSRVTAPSAGRVEIRGRVGTLLEVGTGFHNELTGRENIFLSGAIHGMRRTDIARRFDQIVEFADVARFIDTPVKRYSSGMYMRLAFAVAAHLDPQILLVDEVLAVGDAAFQRKCLGRMSEVAGQGRTVLFVSHDVDAVQRLCPECVLLDDGRVAAFGPSNQVVTKYLAATISAQTLAWIDVTGRRRTGTGEVRFVRVRISNVPDGVAGQPYPEGPLELTLALESDAPRTLPSLAVTLESLSGSKLIEADMLALGTSLHLVRGINLVQFRIQALYLNPGLYSVRLWAGHTANSGFDHVPSAFQLEVVRSPSQTPSLPVTPGAVPCRFEVVQG